MKLNPIITLLLIKKTEKTNSKDVYNGQSTFCNKLEYRSVINLITVRTGASDNDL